MIPGRTIVLCLALMMADSAAAQIKFRHHFIDSAGPVGEAWGTNVIADFDNDGLLDVAVSKTKHGKGDRAAWWYRNRGGIDQWSEARLLRGGLSTGCGGVALDVDRDGWTDFVAGKWLKNPGENVLNEEFALGGWSLGEQIHDMELADFDADGQPEIVVNIQLDESPGLFIFKAGKDLSAAWEKIEVTSIPLIGGKKKPRPRGLVHAAVSPGGIGDLDGDGDKDIAYLNSWAENLDGNGRRWEIHANLEFNPRGAWGSAVRCWVADMDGDQHNDIIQSVCDSRGQPVIWFRNVKGDGSKWEKVIIPFDGKPGDMHSLAVADFDLDGDMDVYVDEMEHLNVPDGRQATIGMWSFENLDGKGTKWKQSQIVVGLGGHQAQIADLDRDGDMDVITRPYTAANLTHGGRMHLSVLENLARNPDATGKGSRFNSTANK